MVEGEIAGPVDPTGVRGLNAVLGGGLPRRALTLVSGPPGSGKTTLAAQLAMAAARAGRRALIVTAFAESTDKLIAHLRTYRFFDADLLGDGLEILSLGQFLDAGMARGEFVILKTRFAAHATARYPDAIVAPMGIVLGDEAGGESEQPHSTGAGRL